MRRESEEGRGGEWRCWKGRRPWWLVGGRGGGGGRAKARGQDVCETPTESTCHRADSSLALQHPSGYSSVPKKRPKLSPIPWVHHLGQRLQQRESGAPVGRGGAREGSSESGRIYMGVGEWRGARGREPQLPTALGAQIRPHGRYLDQIWTKMDEIVRISSKFRPRGPNNVQRGRSWAPSAPALTCRDRIRLESAVCSPPDTPVVRSPPSSLSQALVAVSSALVRALQLHARVAARERSRA